MQLNSCMPNASESFVLVKRNMTNRKRIKLFQSRPPILLWLFVASGLPGLLINIGSTCLAQFSNNTDSIDVVLTSACKLRSFFPKKKSNRTDSCVKARGGGTSIETLYGDVPPKWVGF